ncbi:hypothetical protein C9374_001649 [Naegleria lovaniensis]|uniref:Formate/nitrite transporter n=1 Tax=Naegleria lovaniensis TaxID=51637 RepID=A0AA88GUL7_NAELO|nr:uncharacterized protein C9374_001649 [Naegleria lovaniensis]KAG2387317.1 hypothetical protein C9374_001649 [Naegleria lovaniensis]
MMRPPQQPQQDHSTSNGSVLDTIVQQQSQASQLDEEIPTTDTKMITKMNSVILDNAPSSDQSMLQGDAKNEVVLEYDQHVEIHYKPPAILHNVITDKSLQFNTPVALPTTQSEQPQPIIHHHYHHFNHNSQPEICEKKNSQSNEKPTTTTSIPTTTHPTTSSYPSIVLFNTPFQVMEKMKIEGVRKSKLTVDQMIVLSLFAGIFKGVACTLSLLTAGNSQKMEEEYPGLQKFFFGAVFPIGLILISATGAELFTANVLVVLVGLFSRKWRAKKFIIQFAQFSKNLLLSYVFNMLGAFMMAYFFVYLIQPCCTAHWIEYVKHLAEVKTSKSFGACLASGIVCNMLVTMATYNSHAATTMEGKILGIWFPIMTFVAIGFEHCVANAFFIPLGMLYGANVTQYQLFIGNLLPATIGNIIGGAFVIGCLLYYVYDYRNRHNRILFNLIERIWGKIKDRYRSRNPNQIETTSTQSDPKESSDSDCSDLEMGPLR